MKKTIKSSIMLMLVLLLSNCSSNEENHAITHSMNPPDWIIGRWVPIDSSQPFTNDFVFSNDNLQMSSDGINYLNFNQFGFDDLPGHTFNLTELVISEDAYSFRMTSAYNSSINSDQVYRWAKEENNTLRFEKWWPEGNPNIIPTGTDVSFYKQL